MPLRYKIDVIKALKEKGITTYLMRKDKILSESTIQKLRQGIGVSWDNLEILCKLLQCQPGDIIEFVSDEIEEQYLHPLVRNKTDNRLYCSEVGGTLQEK